MSAHCILCGRNDFQSMSSCRMCTSRSTVNHGTYLCANVAAPVDCVNWFGTGILNVIGI